MTTIEVVVFDLDGVVRHWDNTINSSIEDRHGLPRGSILDTAFDVELGPAAVTGALDYETWAARIAERLDSPAAVAEWGQFRGHLDPDMLALVDAVRAGGCRVGLLSNATTRLEADLEVLGIATGSITSSTPRASVSRSPTTRSTGRWSTSSASRPSASCSPTTRPTGPTPPPRSG